MDPAVRQLETPLGQEVTDQPEVDQLESSADPALEAAGASVRPVEGGENDEALSLLHEAEAMLKIAQQRTAMSWEPLRQGRGVIEQGPLLEARGITLGALHRMVDAIAILQNEHGADAAFS
jgi:hypothetical protein